MVGLPALPALLPAGTHLFTAEALSKAVAEAAAEHPDSSRVFKGSVDAAGVKTVLVLGNKSGSWKVSTAFSHDWTGDNQFGVSGSVAWD